MILLLYIVSSRLLILYIEWIWTNYCKFSRNFVGAIRTTTTNCRVSFIDLYLAFPRKCRKVFLPHTNTVILLEPYCDTFTEPGLPVVSLELFQLAGWNQKRKKTLPNLQYSLTHLLVYRFNTSILMEEAFSLGALTTRRNRLIFR